VDDRQLSCARGLKQLPGVADHAVEPGNGIVDVSSLLFLKVDQE